MNVTNLLAWIGLIVGVIGLGATAVQTARVQRIDKRRQEILCHVIDRANYAKIDSAILHDLQLRNPDPVLARYLWQSHQVSADLYLLAVDEYLSNKRKFTYDDLIAISDTPLVGGGWQFRAWVSKIALRPENQRKQRPEPPEEFVNLKMDRYMKLRTDNRSGSGLEKIPQGDGSE